MRFTHTRKDLSVGAALFMAGALVLTGCSSPAATAPTESSSPVPTNTVNKDLQAKLPQEIRDKGTLTIASPYGVAPSIYLDANGQPTGIAYDVAAGLGDVLGVEVQWQELAFSGVVSGLQAGNFDISMGVIGDTPARQELLDFVDLMDNSSTLLTQKGNPNKITDLETACGKTIGVNAGSLQIPRVKKFSDACVAGGKDPITINEYPGTPDAQAQVQSNRIAAYFAPYLLLNHTARTAGNGQIFELGTGRYPDNPWAIGMQKNRGEMAEAIQGALKAMVDNGTYKAILDKYNSADAALDPEQILVNGAGTPAFPTE
ncbi:ABC transporter substrate-binding protein [Pseudarthrobacter sp. NKDBFgelt]|uniref:ABC transporter substrate-binding protein n=1 Tax=Pseudarthrobacter sp. NKDBFgelt TaxID=3384443 RepID=UPI0038D3FE8D